MPWHQKSNECLLVGRALRRERGESLARVIMVRLGFETPYLQAELPDPIDPRKRFRLDFVWRDESRRLIFGEFDGKAKNQKKQVESGKPLGCRCRWQATPA